MYNLDFNLKHSKLTNELYKKMVKEKYLIRFMPDAGYKEDSYSHYKMTDNGTIYCTQHGFMIPPKGCDGNSTIREQLKAYGITDEKLLDECADRPPVPNY